MTDTTNTIVRWTYIGRRRTSKGLLAFFFIDDDGVDYGFSKLTTVYLIGGKYDVEVTAEGKYLLPRTLAEPFDQSEPRIADWVLETKLATQEVEKAARIKRDTKVGIMVAEEKFRQLTLAELGDRYSKFIGRGRKAALLAQIIEEITR